MSTHLKRKTETTSRVFGRHTWHLSDISFCNVPTEHFKWGWCPQGTEFLILFQFN